MILASNLDIAVAGRLLVRGASFHVGAGDRVGLVGRNGAGKTTLTRVLAGELAAAGGELRQSAPIAYLPQDPRTGDLSVRARDRILSARGLDTVAAGLREEATQMGSGTDVERERAMARYSRLEDRFTQLGGWASEASADAIASSLGLATSALTQSLATLSGGQRRRVELARVLFSGAETLLLDEPTNHLDADSIAWLRSFLRAHEGGVVVISHDVELLEATVNRIFHLDATRQVLDVYNMSWKSYIAEQALADRRRARERANAERRIEAMRSQADRMRASATKARAAHQLDRRALRLEEGVEQVRKKERVARLRFPKPAPCGRTPLRAEDLSKRYGSLEIFSGVDLAVDRSSRVVVLGLNGAGKTTLLRILAGVDVPDTGFIEPGHGLRLGYYAQEHETLDAEATVFRNVRAVAPAEMSDTELRGVLGAFLFDAEMTNQAAGTLSGGEKTRLALASLVVSSANVLLLDEPTNNLDPASRNEVLEALHNFAGAIVLVTHDPGAIEALAPERVLLMPDGVEDFWSEDLFDLVTLS